MEVIDEQEDPNTQRSAEKKAREHERSAKDYLGKTDEKSAHERFLAVCDMILYDMILVVKRAKHSPDSFLTAITLSGKRKGPRGALCCCASVLCD